MHRAHDYRYLVERWRALAKRAGLRWHKLAMVGKYPIFALRSPALQVTGGVYISAGIHGDEPGATEGLYAWAEKHTRRLAKMPLLVLPCLNPWGLVTNSRYDSEGRDLNRSFHLEGIPEIAAVRKLVHGYHFAASMMLHEDYDGEGCYLYELQRTTPYWGETLLQAAAPILPLESRVRVDGRKAKMGLIRRRMDLKRFGKLGYPEAIWLHLQHSERTFTMETPSEFALPDRVAAQVAVLEEMMRLTLAK